MKINNVTPMEAQPIVALTFSEVLAAWKATEFRDYGRAIELRQIGKAATVEDLVVQVTGASFDDLDYPFSQWPERLVCGKGARAAFAEGMARVSDAIVAEIERRQIYHATKPLQARALMENVTGAIDACFTSAEPRELVYFAGWDGGRQYYVLAASRANGGWDAFVLTERC